MMETPYLDKMINDLQNHIESIEVAVHAGIPETRAELAEYEAIKTKLKSMVSSSSVSGSCLDCDWQDDITKAETDWCGDYDEFKGENIPTKICPKCSGGVEID